MLNAWMSQVFLDLVNPVNEVASSIRDVGTGVWIAVIAVVFVILAVILIKLDRKNKK